MYTLDRHRVEKVSGPKPGTPTQLHFCVILKVLIIVSRHTGFTLQAIKEWGLSELNFTLSRLGTI